MTRGDVKQWLHGASDPAVVARLTDSYRNLRAIGVGPIRTRAISGLTASPTAGDPPSGSAAGHAPRRITVEVESAVAIAEVDRAPRVFRTRLTLQETPASDGSRLVLVDSQPLDRPQPWDLRNLSVQRRAGVLVLASGSSAEPGVLSDLTARAAAARGRVAAVWGSSAPAVWVLPGSDADAASLLGRTAADLAGVAAVTDGPLTNGSRSGSDRIVVLPQAWRQLSPAGRDVVLTHELFHATVRRETTTAVPMWLSEGLADYVGYRSVDRPKQELAAELVAALKRDGLPTSLPDSAAYSAGGDPRRLAVAYGQSWFAAQTLVDRFGQSGTVALYRELASAPASADPEQTLETALRSRGYSGAALVQDWRMKLNDLLRG